MVTRDDVTAPTYVSGGEDLTGPATRASSGSSTTRPALRWSCSPTTATTASTDVQAGFDPNTSGFADEDNVYVCVELVGQSTAEYTASSCRVLNRTWVATDCFGNQTYHTQAITIEDDTMPDVSVTAPADITLNVNGLCSWTSIRPTRDPACRPTVTIVTSPVPTSTTADSMVDSVSTGCYSIIRTLDGHGDGQLWQRRGPLPMTSASTSRTRSLRPSSPKAWTRSSATSGMQMPATTTT